MTNYPWSEIKLYKMKIENAYYRDMYGSCEYNFYIMKNSEENPWLGWMPDNEQVHVNPMQKEDDTPVRVSNVTKTDILSMLIEIYSMKTKIPMTNILVCFIEENYGKIANQIYSEFFSLKTK